MSGARVCAGATHVPAYGEPLRSGHRIVCGADEDGVTLAVEAGERALAGMDRGSADALYVAVQNGAELDGPFPQVIREALGLRRDIRVVSATADDLGALWLLQAALTAVDAGEVSCALVVAAEAATDRGERANAGAAGLVVAHGAGVAVTEEARASGLTHEETEAPDERFVAHRRWALLAEVTGARDDGAGSPRGTALADFDHVVLSGIDRGLRRKLAAARAEPALAGATDAGPATVGGPASGGATAAASPAGAATAEAPRSDRPAEATSLEFGIAGPAMAVVNAAAHRPDARVGLLAVGSGQAVLASLTTDADVSRFAWAQPPQAPRPATERQAEGPQLPLPLESPFFARTWAETMRLEAARCTACGHVAFPPSQRPICSGCHGRTWEPYELPRTGHLLSAMENRFLPAGFGARIVFALAELEDGQSFSAPMPPEVAGADVAIGDPLRLALRRFSLRDGVPLYSMKFVPEGH